MTDFEAVGRRLVDEFGVPPEPPVPEPTPLEELAAQTRYKLNAAIAIRRQANTVHSRASVRENQYREQLASLQEAIRLVDRSVSNPEKHADDVAELGTLAADVALELTSEDEFAADGEAVADEDEDDQQDDGEGDIADADDDEE